MTIKENRMMKSPGRSVVLSPYLSTRRLEKQDDEQGISGKKTMAINLNIAADDCDLSKSVTINQLLK
jgi:hypothetical protein